MPESTAIATIPLIPGVHEDVDRTLAPPGTLISAVNVRARKGGIAKRNALSDAGVTADAGVFASPCDALGYAAGRQVAVMASRAWAREDIGEPWVEVGRAARARPVNAHWGAFTETSTGVVQSSCATIGDLIATAHFDGADVQVAVRNPAGLVRAAGAFLLRDKPRIFAMGSDFILTMRDASSGDIYGATIDGATLAISAETLIIAGVAAADSYDAAPFNSTVFLLASRIATTTFQVAFVDASFSLGAFRQITVANNDVLSACVYGTDGEGIWTTVQNITGQYIAAFSEDLASTTGGPTGFASFAGAAPAVMTRRNATTVWLVWTESGTSPTRWLMRAGAYDTTAALSGGNVGYAWHLHAASRPWNGTTTSMNIWVHTDGGPAGSLTPWSVQRRYSLLTLSMDLDVPSAFGMLLEPELSPDERSNEQQSFWPPDVAFRTTEDANGQSVVRGYFPALSTIRTQNAGSPGTAALVIYEWETEGGFDARARQVAEVGGQGVVFGGSVQELPSARINPAGIDAVPRGVENGFLYEPAILSAVKTATGSDGLTADALYQFFAVFEYITPDGLRTRSGPSSIVSVTPDAGNKNVELKVSTAPTTEREFSSPPNGTVVHIYGTIGGGNTFQRITPDAGLDVGRGSSSVGFVTFVHSAADIDVLDNEPAYTENGRLANKPAPAHRFGWVGGGYAWVGGLFDPRIVECSKPLVQREPVQFTRNGALRCFLPEACTGGAWMDGACVLFSRTRAYLVSSAAPAADGSPAVGSAQRLPAVSGCIDFRSVVELPDGIGFQSMRGYEVLPRGFGAPRLISGPVQESLRGRLVISATVIGHAGSAFGEAERVGERLLVLVAIAPDGSEPGVRLVYDLDFERWLSKDAAMADSGNLGELVTTWNGRLVVASRSATVIRYEEPTVYGPTEAGAVAVKVADARIFGAMGRGSVFSIQLLGEIRTEANVSAVVYFDGKYSEPKTLGEQEVRGEAGDKFTLEWPFPVRECQSVGVDLTVTGHPDENGEALVLHSLGIEHRPLAGRARVGQDRTG